jgi:AcrR family transcriptional regulator
MVCLDWWVGSGLSFQMIAKKCKISTSNIVYHFESRDLLLKALLEKISANNYSIVSKSVKLEDNAYQRILNHFHKNLEWSKQFPEEAQIVIQIYLEASYNKDFSPLFMGMIQRAQDRIREHVLAGIREGIFKPSLHPIVLARLLHNMLIGAFIYIMGTRLTGIIETSSQDWEDTLKKLLGYQS